MSLSTSQAFNTLAQLRDQAIALQGQGQSLVMPRSSSSGLGFSVNGQRFFCAAELIREVGVCTSLITVPQTKAWMRGIVNSKGVLFSVVDVAMLAGSTRPTATQRGQGHLMFLGHQERQCALLVSRVIGFRGFDFSNADQRDIELSDDWEGLSAFIGKKIEEDDQSWLFLDVAKLIESEVFLEVQ